MRALLWNTSDIDVFVHPDELYDLRDAKDASLEAELLLVDGRKPTGKKIRMRYGDAAAPANTNGYDIALNNEAYKELAKCGHFRMKYDGENRLAVNLL